MRYLGAVTAAQRVLRSDPTMAALVRSHGLAPVGSREPFAALVRAVIAQSLSTHAANAVRERLHARLDPSPDRLARTRVTTLRKLGLTTAKAACLREAAAFALSGGFAGLTALPDDEIVRRLTAIRGVGPWTAQMVMLFGLGREDIWPLADVAVQRAARQLYGVDTEEGLVALGERFKPFRSHATWYLWRSLED